MYFHVEVSQKKLSPAHISLKAWSPNNKYASVSKVETKKTEKRGDISIAKKNLDQGEVALEEEPFIRQLNRNLYDTHCYYCFKAITEKPIHCRVKTCDWNINYCNQQCEKKSWSIFHSWTCRFPELDQPELRDVLFALQGYIVSRSKSSFVIPNLVSHGQHCLDKEAEATVAKIASLFYIEASPLITILNQIKHNSFAIKQAASVPVNSSFVVSREAIHLGRAVYLSASKLNHSCDPNALVVFGNSDHPCQLQIQSIKGKIYSGQEITISYGPLATKQSTEERRKKLKHDYSFDCECDACDKPSGDDLSKNIYKCQICKTGRLYRQQAECKECGQPPYWTHFIQTETKAESLIRQNKYLEALPLQEGIYHNNVLKLGETYDKLAQTYCVNNQMNLAATYCQKSLQVTQSIYGKISIEVAEEMMKLSTLLFNSKQKPAAMKQINATMVLYKILGLDKSAPEDIEELEDMRSYLTFIR